MSIDFVVEDARARLADFVMPVLDEAALPDLSAHEAAKYIDHTLLKPEAGADAVRNLCREAAVRGFAAVCVNSVWVARCHAWLGNTDVPYYDVAVCAVVGFPLGATLSPVKAFETQSAVEAGATEVDMVLNIGALRDGDYATVARDIEAVVEAAQNGGARVKVIFETCLLSDEEKAIAAALSVAAGADFIKTSTGFSTGGATLYDVALMRYMVGDTAGVKAAGGIRTGVDMRKMIAAGATRIGTSAGCAILASLGEPARPVSTVDKGTTVGEPHRLSTGEDY